MAVFKVIIVVTFVILFLGIVNCKSYKGLFVMTFGTKSHTNFFGGVTKALAKQGHEMTFISPYEKIFKKEEKINEIFIPENDISKILSNVFNTSFFEMFKISMRNIPQICVNALTNPEVVQALKEDYDYIIMSYFMAECFLDYTYQKKIPFMYASPNVLITPYGMRVGAPDFSSVTPNKYTTMAYPLSFLERSFNALIEFTITYTTDYATKLTENLCREKNLWPPESPSALELQNHASLAIINSVRALEIPVKSTPPTVIYAGGIHIEEPKSLPQDLKEWLDGSGDEGFILFSLGTGAKPEDMKPEHFRSILSVFRTLDQRIIWKWNAKNIENLPSNVKLSPWLPQQDVLAHPKIRLFITHGGLFSSQETTYFGIPILGMPIFGDQMSNVEEFVAEGWGLQLKWADVNEDTFRSAILDALTNSSIRREVARRSKLMKDWPTNPADEVVYWVEYVVRHKGAKHLQSPFAHMPWYEIYNMDAWAFIFLILISVLIILFYFTKFCFKLCLKLCFRKKRKTE